MGRQNLLIFDGWIAGLGSASGTRIVLGHWPTSPFGPISDLMVETPDGHRRLLAPSEEVAEFIAATYTFDAVELVEVAVQRTPAEWTVRAGPLELDVVLGRRSALGMVLRLVPGPLARSPRWISLIGRPAALLLPGVRTTGSAGNGRREWYGARDLHPIVALRATLDGVDLGALAPVEPPVTFGFGSVPPRPALVRVTTTVEVPA